MNSNVSALGCDATTGDSRALRPYGRGSWERKFEMTRSFSVIGSPQANERGPAMSVAAALRRVVDLWQRYRRRFARSSPLPVSITEQMIHDAVTGARTDSKLPLDRDRALLGAILDALPEQVFLVDREGKLVAVLGGRDVDHFHDGSGLAGRYLHDVLPESRATEFLGCVHEALETNSVVELHYQLDRSEIDGVAAREGVPDTQWFEGLASPLPPDDDRDDLVVWMTFDVTDLRRTQHELERLARTDGLTGLLNHRTFFEEAERELAWSRRSGQPQALLALDLDQFKEINDSFGHAAGDAVLREVGRILSNEVRSVDVLGRMGGEEFAIISRGSDIHQGLDLAERLRSSIEAMHVEHLDLSLTCTASIGVTQIQSTDNGPDDALRRADAALYEAKHNGRNRVEAHTPTG